MTLILKLHYSTEKEEMSHIKWGVSIIPIAVANQLLELVLPASSKTRTGIQCLL